MNAFYIFFLSLLIEFSQKILGKIRNTFIFAYFIILVPIQEKNALGIMIQFLKK